jgi:KDO2-lipid IV(A) lauroyltransferase
VVLDLFLVGIVETFRSVLRFLPDRLKAAVGAFLGTVAFHILGGRREVALSNLERVFPELPEGRREAIARQFFANLGVNFIELLMLPFLPREGYGERFSLRDPDNVQEILDQGKGVLGLVFHYANWEIMGVIGVLTRREVVVLARPLKRHRLLNDYLNRMRGSASMQIIPNAETARDVMRAIRDGKIVAILADQREKRSRGIPVELFGEKAMTNKGIVTIAMKTGAPVIPVYLERKGFLRYDAVLAAPIPMDREGDLQELIYTNTRKINVFLESLIRRRPEEWFWVHRRWGRRDRRAGIR